MNEFWEMFQSVLLVIIIFLGKKTINSYDAFINEKAKNLATKQDVEEITRKVESVQTEYKQRFERFYTDLQFKYKIYEQQYDELYSKLYQIVCSSESVRLFALKFNDINLPFDEVPLAYLDDTGKNENPLLNEIVDLVNQNYKYAFPTLLKVVSALCVMREQTNYVLHQEEAKKLNQQLKKDLVKIILKEYSWLRAQLHLSDCTDESDKLDDNSFIISAIY